MGWIGIVFALHLPSRIQSGELTWFCGGPVWCKGSAVSCSSGAGFARWANPGQTEGRVGLVETESRMPACPGRVIGGSSL